MTKVKESFHWPIITLKYADIRVLNFIDSRSKEVWGR